MSQWSCSASRASITEDTREHQGDHQWNIDSLSCFYWIMQPPSRPAWSLYKWHGRGLHRRHPSRTTSRANTGNDDKNHSQETSSYSSIRSFLFSTTRSPMRPFAETIICGWRRKRSSKWILDVIFAVLEVHQHSSALQRAALNRGCDLFRAGHLLTEAPSCPITAPTQSIMT